MIGKVVTQKTTSQTRQWSRRSGRHRLCLILVAGVANITFSPEGWFWGLSSLTPQLVKSAAMASKNCRYVCVRLISSEFLGFLKTRCCHIATLYRSESLVKNSPQHPRQWNKTDEFEDPTLSHPSFVTASCVDVTLVALTWLKEFCQLFLLQQQYSVFVFMAKFPALHIRARTSNRLLSHTPWPYQWVNLNPLVSNEHRCILRSVNCEHEICGIILPLTTLSVFNTV